MNKIISILHLENDFNDSELVREMLVHANINCKIDVVETEVDFKNFLHNNEIDLILGDYSLPTYDGLSALEYVSNNFPFIPFILVSGSLDEDAGIESLLHGASDYISKTKLARLVPAINRSLKQAVEHKKRKLAEQELIESKKSLLLAQQVGNIGSWDVDFIKNKLTWSEQTYIQFGLKPDEIEPTEMAFQRFIHPDEKENVAASIKNTLENKAPYSIDVKMLRADGSEWFMHSQGSVIRDKNGNPTRFIGIQQDITERKIIEKELQQSEERYKSLFEANLAGVYKSTIDGRILACNEAFAKMFGYSTIDEVLNTSAEQFYINKNARLEYLSKLKKHGKLFNQEVQILRKDRSDIWITENVVLMKNNVMLGTVIDITATKLMTQELIEARNNAVKADKLKSEFLAQMSHEIRTPINTILNSLAMIKSETSEPMSDDLAYFYNAVNKASFRLIRTIELILNMSELQLGIYEPNFENVNIEIDVIKQLVHEFNPTAKKKGLELSYSTQAANKIIRVDEYSVIQIFANLIDNAIKFTNNGKIHLFFYESVDGNLNIDVSDSGIGIDSGYLPYLFDSFSQEQQGYTRSFEGSGLGMAIVKGYCNLNKANISVVSEKGNGTKFTVTFPKECIIK